MITTTAEKLAGTTRWWLSIPFNFVLPSLLDLAIIPLFAFTTVAPTLFPHPFPSPINPESSAVGPL